MTDALARVLATAPTTWQGLGRRHQVLLAAFALLVPGLLLLGGRVLSDVPYVPLFASLTPEEGGAVVTQLKAAKVAYRVGPTGEILVPADRVGELRLRMAAQGVPLGGGVGFEVFDKPALGASDFSQRLNYQRALQGELARTIAQLREVDRARVHLALPPPALFTERERPPSASVVLKLVAGATLGREQIRGIVHLVASSVEGLAPERVTVVDTAGRVLAMGGDPAGGGVLSPRRLELKTAVEETLERRIQTLLDATVGPGQALTRVSAQVNFDQVERTEERYDPSAVARQRTRSVDANKGSTTTPMLPAGTPDVLAPAPSTPTASSPPPPPPPPTTVTQNEANRQSESITYELSRVVARTLIGPGEIQRLSVAVILNAPARRDASGPPARPAEELEKIRKVVMGAVGFNEQRGDEVTVVEMPFDTSALDRERALLEQAPAPGAEGPGLPLSPVMWAAGVGVIVLALVGVAWIAVRLRGRRPAAVVPRELPPADEPVEGPAEEVLKVRRRRPMGPLVPDELLALGEEREGIKQKALALATSEPEATAQLLRTWLVKTRPAPTGRVGG